MKGIKVVPFTDKFKEIIGRWFYCDSCRCTHTVKLEDEYDAVHVLKSTIFYWRIKCDCGVMQPVFP